MARDWLTQTKLVNKLLTSLEVDERGKKLKADKGFERWSELLKATRQSGRQVFLAGNGLSAALASQFAVDLTQRGRLHTEPFANSPMLSAIANDMGYEWTFAEPLQRRGKKGDVLICISTTGRSVNVLKAENVANRLGITTITLTACEPENPMRRDGYLNFYVEARSRGDAHACFQSILHHGINLIKLDESETVEIKYHELFPDMGRPVEDSATARDPDSAFFLP